MNKSITAVILIIVSAAIAAAAGYYYFLEKQKSPFERTYRINDTDTFIEASYNDKHKVIRLNVTIDEVIEDWQINTIGDRTDMNMECETADKTVKKDYYFYDIPVKSGEKIKASLIIENSSVKDFSLTKDLLSGNIKIENSKYLTFDTKERDKLQKEYYKEQEKQSASKTEENKPAPRSQPAPQRHNNSFMDNLFNF